MNSEILVRIVRNWDWPDLFNLTPHRSGRWGNIQFTEEPVPQCDYIIISNNLDEEIATQCPPQNIWRVVQEPPSGPFKAWHQHPAYAAKTFTCDPDCSGPRYIRSHPMLPWHVNRDYDFLVSAAVPQKEKMLSWITGTRGKMEGHRLRMDFLKFISGQIPQLDLLGGGVYHLTRPTARKRNDERQQALGFKPIADKWAGLAPYKYSLAVENTLCPDYWTEKIGDCFLARTVPIYFGCPNLENYFPKESFIRIDIREPQEALDHIREVLARDSWETRLAAVEEARDLVLNKYQFFPAMARHIQSQSQSQSQTQSVPVSPPVKPRISVIVCTYNRDRLLPECLESLANQRAPDQSCEVLVIDNNSTDNTPQVAGEYVKKYPHFKYFFEPEQGLSHARNRGIKEAAAGYVAFIDDESRAGEGWLEEALKIIREHKPDIFGGAVYPLFPNGKPQWFKEEYGVRGDMGQTGWIKKGFIPGGNMFCRKGLIKKYGGFDPNLGMKGDSLAYGEDALIVCKALEDNKKVYFSRELAIRDRLPEYKKHLAFFIYFLYRAGKDIGTLKNHSYEISQLPQLLQLIDDTLRQFENALNESKRTGEGFAYPENYIIEKLRKNFVEIGKRMAYFLKEGTLTEEALTAHYIKNAEPDVLARYITEHHSTPRMLSKIIFSGFKQSRLLHPFRERNRRLEAGKAVILTYHRVTHLDPDPYHMAVPPALFEEQLRCLKTHFNVVSLPELARRIIRRNPLRNCVVITFDDGYTDNLYTIKPLLKKYRLPATFFITSAMTHSNREFWWDELERIFSLPDPAKPLTPLNITVRDQAFSWDVSGPVPPAKALGDMHRLLRFLPHPERETIMEKLFQWAQLDRDTPRETHRVLNAVELRELARGKSIEIGCHSHTHAALNKESPERLALEISQSRTILEQVIHRPIRGFSYPFGLEKYLDDQVLRMVKEARYSYGISNIQAEVRHDSDIYCLPRRVVKHWDARQFREQLEHFLFSEDVNT